MIRSLLLVLSLACLAACGGTSDATDAGSSSDASGCAALTCASLDVANTRWDGASKTLTLVLRAGVPQVNGGSISYDISSPSGTSTKSVVFTVSGSELTAALGPTIPADAFALTRPSITLVEACGRTSIISDLTITTATMNGALQLTGFSCP